MKINIDWLREYVDVPESAEKLRDDLTMSGLVVESIGELHGCKVLEIEVTSNRPDCLSHFGVAREVAALYDRPLRQPAAQHDLKLGEERVPFGIEILDPDLCPRYAGLVLDNVTIGSSPEWMRKRLESAGMRPVNNVVDITNYVLLEVGHPLHAFDFEVLKGGKIIVARAGPGRKMTTLDGIERLLDSEMLLIHDGEAPVAIAGVMGGFDSEIALGTRTVLLESAYFKPASVRRTARRLGLSTEASYRFERGVDWDGPVRAIARTCHLMKELTGARLAGSLQDVYPQPIAPVRIQLRRKRAEALLGVALTDDFVESSLSRVGFSLEHEHSGVWQVTCPSYRADMELEADLIEEVARFHGYENIPATLPPSRTAGIPSPDFQLENSTRRILIGLGYNESINLSFATETENREYPVQATECAAVQNPLTEDTRYLRATLVPGLVRSAKCNFNHGLYEVRLFEIGKVYGRGQGGILRERNTLGILGTGRPMPVNWQRPSAEFNFYHLRGTLGTLLAGLRSAPYEVEPAPDVPWLDSTSSARLLLNKSGVGVFGALHPALAERYKIRQPVFVAEIDMESLAPHSFQPVCYEALPRFPAVERDLSIVIGREVAYRDVESGIMGLGIRELQSIELLDVYEGENIPVGCVSLTLRCVFLDREKTLTVDRVQGFSDNVVAFLSNRYAAELR